MLIITRKNRGQFKIGDDITVTVLEINGIQCRLGISAPRNVEVHRGEVYELIKRDRNSTPDAS